MLIVWDYFGVVAGNPYWDEVDEWAERNKVYDQLRQVQLLSDEGKLSWDEYCQQVSKMTGRDIDTVQDRYAEHRVNKATIAIVRSLTSHRHVLLSNASHQYLLPIMSELGLDTLFEQCFVSSELGIAKPDPAAYRYVLNQMGSRPEESIAIDDGAPNIEGAKSIGMSGIVFTNATQCAQELSGLVRTTS